MDDAALWNALPAEEQRSVWDETEQKFWSSFEKEQEDLHAVAENDYQKGAMHVRVEMGTLTGKRTQLAETRERLSRELTKIEEELARVAEACDEKATKLIAMEQDYRKSEHARLQRREQVVKTMEDFFRQKRGEDADAAHQRERRLSRDAKNGTTRPRRDELPHPNATPREEVPLPSQPLASTPAAPAAKVVQEESGQVLVNVTDADGNVIGPVKRIDPWNQWVKDIQDMPVKRQVRIRRGRKFNQDHLATIYDRSEGKGVKWLSCMIQATGEIQPHRCHSCDKNQGAFDDCIVLGGPLFQKCGNCEWNRQGCHMPLAGKPNNAATPQKGRSSSIKKPLLLQPDAETAARVEAVQEALAKAAGLVKTPSEPAFAASEGQETAVKSPVVPEPVQMLTPQEPNEHGFAASSGLRTANGFATLAAGLAAGSGFTPANARSRPPSRDIPTPSAASAENSPRPTPPATSEPPEEITRENLVLRHDGTVYTYPEIVEGVPVEKIDQNHPYWDPAWPCIKSVIEPQLESWREKNITAQKAKERGEGGSARFQTGRQVNRGGRILEFLEHGEISPYQLLSKSFTSTGKGAITSYDTLFRLCETLSELAKFNLDVTPVEWLRHRLHEIMMHKGSNFNVSKTIHDFYHDPKLSALRSKNGFKSIGRPSGYKPVTSNGTPQGSSKKRKSMHSQAGTPRDTPSSAPSPLAVSDFELSPKSAQETSLPPEAPLDAQLAKRPKHFSPLLVSPPARGELVGPAYSDTDSWSGAALAKEDWRVYQVKTRLFVSSAQVTQYWNWKEKERMFEHQVLKETNPLAWGVHRDPIDFNVRLDDMIEVRWNVDALMVHLVMSSWGMALAKQDGLPRGDVMAAFKRERTIRRFVRFCRDKKLRTVEVSPDDMDLEWGKMQPERLPVADDEASEALKE